MGRCFVCWGVSLKAPGPAAAFSWVAAACWLLPALALAGQPPPLTAPQPSAPASERLSVEQLQNRAKEIRESTDLDDEFKARLGEIYKDAIQALTEGSQASADAARYELELQTAADELEKARTALSQMPERVDPRVPDEATLPQLTQALAQHQAELAEAKKELSENEDRLKRRASQRIELPKQIAAVRERLADVEKQLQSAPAGDSPQLVAAQRALLWARRQNLSRQVDAMEKKLAAYDATVDLIPLRRDLARRRVTLLEQEVTAWQATVDRRRQQDVEEQSRLAQRIADRVPEALRPRAEGNLELVQRRNELDRLLREVDRDLQETSRQREHFSDQYGRVLSQVEAVGLSKAVGLLLRKQRQNLPSLRELRSKSQALQKTVGDVHFRLLELEDRRSALADLEAELRATLAGIDGGQSGLYHDDLEMLVRDLLQSERDYLDGLARDYNTYFHKLVSHDTELQKLIQTVETFTAFIDQRVLWISSAPPVQLETFRQARDAVAGLAKLSQWRRLVPALLQDARDDPFPLVALVLMFGPLIYNQRRMRDRLVEFGEAAERGTCQQFRPTLRALLCTILISALWPGLLWCLGWRLTAAESGELGKALGSGIMLTAALYLPLEFLRQASRGKGLIAAHFGWSPTALAGLRRNLRWLTVLLLPLSLIAATLEAYGNARWSDSLGRSAFILFMLLLGLFFMRVLRPIGGVFHEVIAYNRGCMLDRFKSIWYPVAVLLPLVLAALAAVGYYYTAQSLALRLQATIAILLALQLVKALLLRWILVSHRRIAIEQARQRWAAAAAEQAAAAESESAGLPPVEEPQLDFTTISAQTHRLVKSFALVGAVLGLWLIWVGVAPALAVLDHVELWHNVVEEAEGVPGPDGTVTLRPVLRYVPVTLARVALALVVLTMTVIATRNIPGLLEVILLQHLPLDAALRFAITTVIRYVIILVGLVATLSMVGVSWGQIQWLVAAVSVGLGFGLQEIFANFVSGLIIMFERPLRVGDIVTVGDVSGKVAQIRIRATVIVDWERKELIVPNKEFITGRLLNWTLSDQVTRVLVHVGVAYDADPVLVRELISDVATGNPLILDDPAPLVAFEQFGDNALHFTLRAYLPNLDNRLKVITELHTEILQRFRDHGIEIAYPQRDIHIRTIDKPLALVRSEAEESRRRKESSSNGDPDRSNGDQASAPGEEKIEALKEDR